MRDGTRASGRGGTRVPGGLRRELPASADAAIRAADGQRHSDVRERTEEHSCGKKRGIIRRLKFTLLAQSGIYKC